MSAANCITDATAPAVEPELAEVGPERVESDPGARARKRLFVCFAGTMFLGFGLTGWYVQERLVSTETAVAPEAAAVTTSAAPIAPPSLVAVTPERYLQVTSLGPRQDARFLRRLSAEGFEARLSVDSGARPQILIGPFGAADALEHAQRKLSRDGILALETTN